MASNPGAQLGDERRLARLGDPGPTRRREDGDDRRAARRSGDGDAARRVRRRAIGVRGEHQHAHVGDGVGRAQARLECRQRNPLLLDLDDAIGAPAQLEAVPVFAGGRRPIGRAPPRRVAEMRRTHP